MQVNESAVSTHVAGKAPRQIGCREVAWAEGDQVMQAHVGELKRCLHEGIFCICLLPSCLAYFSWPGLLTNSPSCKDRGFAQECVAQIKFTCWSFHEPIGTEVVCYWLNSSDCVRVIRWTTGVISMAILWLLSHATFSHASDLHSTSFYNATVTFGPHWVKMGRRGETVLGNLGTFVQFLVMNFQMPPALDQRCLKLRKCCGRRARTQWPSAKQKVCDLLGGSH